MKPLLSARERRAHFSVRAIVSMKLLDRVYLFIRYNAKAIMLSSSIYSADELYSDFYQIAINLHRRSLQNENLIHQI